MSLLKRIGKIAGKVLKSPIGKVVGSVIPGAGPIISAAGYASAAAGAIKAVRGATRSRGLSLPTLSGAGMPSLPTLGNIVTSAGAGYAGGMMSSNDCGCTKKKRRRKGISGKDLQSFRRVARLVDKFSKPVQKMRNFKK